MRHSFSLLLYIAGLIIGLGSVAAVSGWQAEKASNLVHHTFLVLYKEIDLFAAAQDIDSSSRGYAITKSSDFRQQYIEAKDLSVSLTAEFKALTADETRQQPTITTGIQPAMYALLDASQKVLDTGSADAVMAQRAAMKWVRKVLRGVRLEEQRLLAKHEDETYSFAKLFWLALMVQLIAGCLLVVAVVKSLRQYQMDNNEKLLHLNNAKEEAIVARKVAEQALEAKSRFLSIASHEVRTPMSGVIGFAEILSLQDLGTENNATIKAILMSSKRLLKILNDVLEVARLESGKVTLEQTDFPVRSVLGEVRQLVVPDAARKQLSVIGFCDDRIPEFVCGDELRIRQILLNLAFNAVKFTASGRIAVSAVLKETTIKNIIIRFIVKDTGMGISAADQRRIFVPFEQASETGKHVLGGSGLGLAISKELVELMGGQIGVDSEPGQGSTFWFEVPFVISGSKL